MAEDEEEAAAAARQEELFESVKAGSVDRARELLGSGASPSLPQSQNGISLAHHAAMNSDLEMLELLIEAGADINSHNDGGGGSVLQFAAQGYMHGDCETSINMVKTLTKDNRITQRDILGNCLTFCSGRGFIELVQVLLEAHADPDYYREGDDYCLTPLIGLIFENEQHENHPEIAKMLVAAGANPDHIGRSRTALDYAEDYEREDMIDVLKDLMLQG